MNDILRRHVPPQAAEKLQNFLQYADSVLVGAGAGLSTSAGYTYTGERFWRYFADFGRRYHFQNMYEGGFYPYPSPEEYWAYWSRYIFINRYMPPPENTYETLLDLIRGKDYFVLTTNVDHMFQRAGFDKKRLFYTQGDYGLLQCTLPCHRKTYENETLIRQMVQEQQNMKVPSALIPYCPLCGRPMRPNLREDSSFVQDDGWESAAGRYTAFLQNHQNARILYLELGVGFNTPAIIKYPFWQFTQNNPLARYVCINQGSESCPEELAQRSICLDADIDGVLRALTRQRRNENGQTPIN